ncbi:uncharacterized protein LOC6035280 isoform X1 [Culex quinquefasciatus]|uniref:uncharacterized protein LOC6035280 isoform X1 n=1 Tax=Culex quinquefasciatus TaxID=7176 RepID=UPI0018E360BA|nr:uncharacterized protein LOC6035280 isoform X1 [Culex quinquefasciatus]
MIKPKLLLVLLLGSCLSDITSGNDDATLFHANSLDNVKGHHFSQHEATVNAARRGAAERLARISAGGVGNPCGTTICYSSSGFSDNNDAETIGQGIVGFASGASGSTSASSSKYQASALEGVAPIYPVAGGSKSSYVSSSHRQSSSSVASGVPNYIAATDGVKTRSSFGSTSGSSYGSSSGATLVQPVIAAAYPIGQESSHSSLSSANRELYTYPVPVVDASNAYKSRSNYAASSERQASSVVQPVPVYSSGDQASRYIASGRQDSYQGYRPANTYVVYSKPVPVQVYTPVTSNLETAARFANADSNVYTQAPVKVVYPVRSSTQYSANDEQQTYSASAVQPIYSSSADRASQGSNYRSSSSYQPVYQPVYGGQVATAERSEESRRHSSERVGYPVDNTLLRTSAHNERHEDYNRRGSTYVPHAAGSGSVSKYSTYDQAQHANVAGTYVPIVPVTTDSRYSAQDQRHSTAYNSAVVQPVIGTAASSSSSKYSAEERRQQQTAGGQYYPAGSATLGSRYASSEAQSAHNRQQSQVAGGYSPYPITNDALGRQFGAAGIGQLGTHTDLNELMTEAERLAKVQAQNAHNGAVSGSAAIDTENRFGGGSDDAVSGGTGGSGFQRTKSWSSSSKWASGQKYGDDGKIKSYSSLSTAESEQHNINGKKTGYKAATSTLEDDGKVSTYSLHTP